MDLLPENTENPRIILHISPDDLKNNLSINELIALAGLYHKDFEEFVDEELFETLLDKGYIIKDRFQIKLSNKGTLLIKKMTTRSSIIGSKVSKRKIVPEIESVSDEFVQRYRSLFKGTKVGAMGSEKIVNAKLTRFMKENPKATEDMVIEATRRYINNLESYRYIQKADYFIYKRDIYTHEEASNLSAYLDEVIANPNESDDDWTTKLI